MFGKFFKKKETDLAKRCREYLEAGPPTHMQDYVPESLTEILIAHGAQQQEIDNELREIGSIIILESDDLTNIEDIEIRNYMTTGTNLVQEILIS